MLIQIPCPFIIPSLSLCLSQGVFIMHKIRIEAAQGVADRLILAENALDNAVTAIADLVGFLPQARINAHLACEVVQPAFALATDTLGQLGKARGTIVAAHKALAETRDQIGLGTHAFGGLYGKPSAEADLPAVRLVADNATSVA
jgi:hypothetical protein